MENLIENVVLSLSLSLSLCLFLTYQVEIHTVEMRDPAIMTLNRFTWLKKSRERERQKVRERKKDKEVTDSDEKSEDDRTTLVTAR